MLLLGATACAQFPPDEDDDIPVVGRPTDVPFSEASGQFKVSARATPTEVQAEDPLTYTLRVEAIGVVRKPPVRIDLKKLPRFAGQFLIDAPAEPETHPAPNVWEFHYKLQPKSPEVSEIPALPFVFYNPTITIPDRRFNRAYTEPIPIKVTPRVAVAVPMNLPEWVFREETGPAVLARQEPASLPGLFTIAAALIIPPVLCVGWYFAWRRLYPDAARMAEMRRSRAARVALEALERLRPEPVVARQAARIVTRYLRQRFDLYPSEPTPAEVAAFLRRLGYAPPLSEQAGQFYARCDAARFLPVNEHEGQLPGAARELILALETPE